MYKILIVEDDPVIFEELKKLFERNGYAVLDGSQPDTLAAHFDLAVLDIGLSEISGYEICSKLRETKKVPVIFLTSMDKPENELKGFSVGGDDFIRKPFNTGVLIARVERLLKKTDSEIMVRGGLTLNTARLEVCNGSQKMPLTKTEFIILKTLAGSSGVVSGKELIEKLWDNEAYIDENALYVNINRLREKLKEIALGNILVTVRGAGYQLGD